MFFLIPVKLKHIELNMNMKSGIYWNKNNKTQALFEKNLQNPTISLTE